MWVVSHLFALAGLKTELLPIKLTSVGRYHDLRALRPDFFPHNSTKHFCNPLVLFCVYSQAVFVRKCHFPLQEGNCKLTKSKPHVSRDGQEFILSLISDCRNNYRFRSCTCYSSCSSGKANALWSTPVFLVTAARAVSSVRDINAAHHTGPQQILVRTK